MKPPSTLTLGLITVLVHAGTLHAQEIPATEPPAPNIEGQQAPVPARQAPRPQMPSGPIEVNGIAAKVNGHVVTKNEISFMLAPIYAQLASQFPRRGSEFERQFKLSRDGIVQELVDRQIILDEFKVLGANIKDILIDEEIKRQVRDLFNGDEAKFQLELKHSHLTMDGYRKMTKDKMIVQAMRANQFSDAPPPLPNEIQQEYDAIKLTIRDTSKDRVSFKKIFLPREDKENLASTPDSQLTLAETLAKQLGQGKDFAALAKTHSRDAFAAQGGVQKNVPRPDLSPEFAAIIFDAKPGKLLGPLEDAYGFTLVIPTQIDYGPSPALDGKVREMIEERVRRKKTSAQYDRWITSRRKKAMIDIKPM
ncbi:MAG: peptidylprolyl isomerase [Verrucomicrobiota bacterium]